MAFKGNDKLFEMLATMLPGPAGMAAGPKAIGGFAHSAGQVSPENIKRAAEFWKITKAGKILPMLKAGAEDAAMTSKDVIVRMTPDGIPVVEGGTVTPAIAKALNQIPKFGTQAVKEGKKVMSSVRELVDGGGDIRKFLKDLGVELVEK